MAYSIRISGTVLSALLHECANSTTDIEGLFLGSLSLRKTLASDDSTNHSFEKREDFMIIHGYQILKEKPYDTQGNLIKPMITSQLSDVASLVGYFKFRRQTDVTLSVRDQLMMTSWSKIIPSCCISILSSSLNSFEDKSTHTYEFAFWDMKTGSKLPMVISNMSESTALYKNFMSNALYRLPQHSSNSVLTQLPSSQSIVDQYDQMYQQSIKSLQEATDKVVSKENELIQLKKEIQSLKKSRNIV
ncbi:unnamed protein product [Mucor hiemalis]